MHRERRWRQPIRVYYWVSVGRVIQSVASFRIVRTWSFISGMAFVDRIGNFFEGLADRFRDDNNENRRDERILEAEMEALGLENDVVDESVSVKVVGVDFQAKLNAANHNCDKYELVELKGGTPIIRRGGNFTMIIQLNKEVDLKKLHQVKLYFSFGPSPSAHNGTLAVLLVTGKKVFDKNYEQWDVRVADQEGTKATLDVQVPIDVPVGVWRPAVEVSPRNGDGSKKHILRLDTLVYILFNPWNKRDVTYLPEEEKRQEYVLRDVGKIWVGSYPTGHGRHWVFGQFDDVVLPACILLMEKSGLRPEARGDPIRVSRAISRMVNSNNGGVVVGRWDGEYDDGMSPSGWTGSIKIMEEFIKTNKPVRYGQCWVFAGVVNTVCRALGLPSRVVSNFNSAHDTNVSLTIDEYFDEKGVEIEGYSFGGSIPSGVGDSIWNFHVWNDVWMTRPDLPPGYGGWQAIDSTPQEQSNGIYQCGPASHEAIRRGQTEYKYDVPFVLAEVNADVVRWKEDKTALDGFKKLTSNKSHVGREILTKKPGPVEDDEGDRQDCTTEYKPPEGSKAERVTLYTAVRNIRSARHAYRFPSEAIEDVEFSIEDVKRVPIGDDFAITLKAVSQSEAVRTVTLYLTASSIYYTGARASLITRAEGKFRLQPKETKTLSLPVPYSEYYHKLVENAMVKLVAMCNVEETSYAWVDDDKFEVLKPNIKVKVLAKGVAGKPLPVKFSFINPLPITLKNCTLVVDGPGLTRPKTIPISDVGPKGKMEYDLNVHPKKEAECTLVAIFNSTQLLNLTGSAKMVIGPPES